MKTSLVNLNLLVSDTVPGPQKPGFFKKEVSHSWKLDRQMSDQEPPVYYKLGYYIYRVLANPENVNAFDIRERTQIQNLFPKTDFVQLVNDLITREESAWTAGNSVSNIPSDVKLYKKVRSLDRD